MFFEFIIWNSPFDSVSETDLSSLGCHSTVLSLSDKKREKRDFTLVKCRWSCRAQRVDGLDSGGNLAASKFGWAKPSIQPHWISMMIEPILRILQRKGFFKDAPLGTWSPMHWHTFHAAHAETSRMLATLIESPLQSTFSPSLWQRVSEMNHRRIRFTQAGESGAVIRTLSNEWFC